MKDHLALFLYTKYLNLCKYLPVSDLSCPGEDEYSVDEFCMEGFLGQEKEHPE